jgi:hypothetical protein
LLAFPAVAAAAAAACTVVLCAAALSQKWLKTRLTDQCPQVICAHTVSSLLLSLLRLPPSACASPLRSLRATPQAAAARRGNSTIGRTGTPTGNKLDVNRNCCRLWVFQHQVHCTCRAFQKLAGCALMMNCTAQLVVVGRHIPFLSQGLLSCSLRAPPVQESLLTSNCNVRQVTLVGACCGLRLSDSPAAFSQVKVSQPGLCHHLASATSVHNMSASINKCMIRCCNGTAHALLLPQCVMGWVLVLLWCEAGM